MSENTTEILVSPTPAVRNPVVVIVGRPNVGKSTLVNRIVGRRIAIVEEHPGVTRDRKELVADWRGQTFTLVDTGGVIDRGDALDKKVTEQALRATKDADLVLFLLDATTGITVEDEIVSGYLRPVAGKTLVIANKVDSTGQELDAWQLTRLGFGVPIFVSALHGRGVGDMLDAVVDRLRAQSALGEVNFTGDATDEPASDIAGIAIVGRPNVGKSTLFNRLVGDERSVVHDIPGTTRDSIDTVIDTKDGALRLIDTAGLRRKSRIGEGSEYYASTRSLSTIDTADVVLLVIDATSGVTHQDQRLAERIDASGSPIVIVLNKWELLDTPSRLQLAIDVEDRLAFLAYAPILRISALTGLGTHRLLPTVRKAIDAYGQRIPTGELNAALKAIQGAHPAPGTRILYAVQGAVNPPTFTLFATGRLPRTYLRYIERSLRERFSFGPTPLKLRVRPRGGK